MLTRLAFGLAVILGPGPCFAQIGLNGPFNQDTVRERQIQSGTGVGISRLPPAPSPTANADKIGSTFGRPFGTTVGSTIGSGPGTPVGSTFGSAVNVPAAP